MKLAILGDPVAHSYTPAIYREVAKRFSMDLQVDRIQASDWDSASGFLAPLKCAVITSPLKARALGLPELYKTSACELVGGLNTLWRTGADRWRGFNTDVDGFASLFQSYPEFRQVSILGYGPTARAAALAAIQAPSVTHIGLISRHTEKAWRETGKLQSQANRNHTGWRIENEMIPAQLVIHATPVVDQPNADDWLARQLDSLTAQTSVVECNYRSGPTWLEERLTCFWTGRDVLAAQAVSQISILTGHEVSFEWVREVIDAHSSKSEPAST